MRRCLPVPAQRRDAAACAHRVPSESLLHVAAFSDCSRCVLFLSLFVRAFVSPQHVHTWGDINTGVDVASPSVDTTAAGVGVGPHFNPAGAPHDCFPNATRHAGDLFEALSVDNDVVWTASFERSLIDLGDSVSSIIGRSVVLHLGRDHCLLFQPSGASGAPIAQGVIGIVDPTKYGYDSTYTNMASTPASGVWNSAITRMHATPSSGLTIVGTVQFAYDFGMGLVRVIVNVTGLPPNTPHGFHVHAWGDDSDSNGLFAGGHFNPANVSHALPPTTPRHQGDMGNINADMNGSVYLNTLFDLLTLTGSAPTIIGRSVVIHQLADDGHGATGNAGTRYAYGVIGLSDRVMATSSSSSGFWLSSTGGLSGAATLSVHPLVFAVTALVAAWMAAKV